MDKHTKGPWTFYADTLYGADESVVCTFVKPKNISLIVAAPELLQALKRAKDALANHPDGELWQAIESVINKAEGK